MKRYDSILSLGGACEVAFQIRKFSGNEAASVFDWWITPFDAVIDIVENDFSGLFTDNNMVVVGGRTVRCRQYGITHHHDFKRDAKGNICVEDIQRRLTVLRDKYGMLRERFFRSLSGGSNVLLVRGWQDRLHDGRSHADHSTPERDFISFVDTFRRRFTEANIEFLFVNYGTPTATCEGAKFDNVVDYDDRVDWRGSTRGWQELLARHAKVD